MVTAQSDKSGDRQQQIIDATLALVATEGLLNTSISKISKKAQCSPGIIYHYFNSKDEIMDTLYEQVLKEMTSYTYGDIDMAEPILSRYQAIWLRKYRYHRSHLQKTVFLEQYKNSAYYTHEQSHLLNQFNAPLIEMGETDIEAGEVVNLPLNVIYVMTLGMALLLAKEDIYMQVERDDAMLKIIAERVCRAVVA